MTFLTVFTAPKPFTNPHISIIQRNAIQSWIHLGSQVEVFLMGDEEGMSEIAREYQVQHFPDVRCSDQGTPKINSMIECSELGTPYISSMIELARQSSEAPYLAILNADILLLQDFVEAAKNVGAQAQEFLLLGRRWDLDVEEELELMTNPFICKKNY